MPGWVADAIWWQVYPLGFTGAERSAVDEVHHRLPHLERWLDHLLELGCNGLALGPVFASSTHGYDTVDHFRIDPRLGDEADFDALVAAAHARGVRVLLDGVFNHVGRRHPAFRALAEQGPSAPTADWFRPRRPERWEPGVEPEVDVFEGHDILVELDHSSEAVVDLVTRVMVHWLDRGADGWRLDAAYAVPPEFWARVLPAVRAAHPDAYVVGEVIHGDYARAVAVGGLDAVTQYELWQAVWHGIEERNLFELAWSLKRHAVFLESFVPWTFVGNHDVTRIASGLSDERHLPHAHVVLFTLGGTPAVWSGDEHAFRGVKVDRAGGDDAVRPPFPPDPSGLSPLGLPTFHLHQELIGLRRRHPWLHTAAPEQVHVANEQLVYAVAGRGERLLVALNLADAPCRLPAPGVRGVLAGAADAGRDVVGLPPHGWAVLAG
ncbi:alpha-amylase family glycosyl hydrolase [Saccharothrix yanglingensis]|uniref:Alpha-amylase n=1 Tax=Saccharothrix yanglingensis TaxID=659496 RepID=A0ABU0WYZ8_9PSEU|nr:alpha-amylase family glycosyl hydrolase [Saccharothrix yanglingensis]MDQ2585086.1 alpha-amylase [Saccharothrix yanglingensis]